MHAYALSIGLYRRCRELFLESRLFDGPSLSYKAIMVTTELLPYKPGMPTGASSEEDCISLCIEYLLSHEVNTREGRRVPLLVCYVRRLESFKAKETSSARISARWPMNLRRPAARRPRCCLKTRRSSSSRSATSISKSKRAACGRSSRSSGSRRSWSTAPPIAGSRCSSAGWSASAPPGDRRSGVPSTSGPRASASRKTESGCAWRRSWRCRAPHRPSWSTKSANGW